MAPKFEVSIGILKASSFRSLASKGFPDGYSTCGCVCPPAYRRSEPTRWFSQMTPDKHPRRHHLADGPFSSLYAPSPSLSSCGAASVMMCCSARPASSSAPSVLPEDRVLIYTRRCCDHINVLHIFDETCIVLKLGWRSTTGPPDLWSCTLIPGSPSDATA